MKKPEIPENEEQRLRALGDYQILDTLPEKDYDDITRLASAICDTPISLISLVDEQRQFFKSHHGLEASETMRDYSFCAHAIHNPDDIMLVSDSRKDERFADNPLVEGNPFVVFYAGVPLITPEGYALGTLCSIDTKPRTLNQQQIDALKCLSRQVVHLLELRKKNRQLLDAQQQLKDNAKFMEEFAYMAAHDMKEPLRMVKSFMLLLRKRHTEKWDDTDKKYINFAINGAERMENLLMDLLEYAKAGVVTTHNEQTDLNPLIQEVVELITSEEMGKQPLILFSDLPIVATSKTPLKLLFQNLISNAIKYQQKDAQAQVKISSEQTDTHWKFNITDNGIGIKEEYLQSIFDPFTRLHNRQEYHGSGLGLASCKKIVERCGGTIWAVSEEGKGSTFYFTIAKK